ncbi:hypothetical protein CWE03_01080 [Lactobacillus johnsonii]|uniref:XRE family transcriptional regulator n=1 Tax=Lactobacillus johnsonii TaxID=33959 RepID=A0AAW5LYC1_LACJH|nr:hypothetical protein [Lactobacillus johnsonii]MCR1914203.1 hypothetical protein [Lactobacillus johnsonii]PJN79205.1 hypothetical protein CWE03_01080 [Lactobacillus johnsonii]
MKDLNEVMIGKPVKISHVLLGVILVVLLSLFVTGFGYLPWWIFLIVLILGIFITLPTCFSSYWSIDKKRIKIITYSDKDIIKLMQLLGLKKKYTQIIDLNQIKTAEIRYTKNVRMSPVDFNPDYLTLYLQDEKNKAYSLSLGKISYQQIELILQFLKENQIEIIDKQGIVSLLKNNIDLFTHFHKKWTAI